MSLDLKSHQPFIRFRDFKECNIYEAERPQFQEFQQRLVILKEDNKAE